MIKHHSRTGEAHHFLHPSPHIGLVAVHGTFPASALPLAELATVQPLVSILQQGLAVRTKRPVPFLQSAIEADHLLHRLLFIFNA
jgi:hypothetical protein